MVARIEVEAYEGEIAGYRLKPEDTKVWHLEGDRLVWVIEVTAIVTVDVSIAVTFYA